MAYNSNVPLASDQLSTSQADILNNFTSLGTFLTPDTFTVKFTQIGAHPATTANTIGFYSADSILKPGTQALYWKDPNTAIGVAGTHEINTATFGANGWSVLPSGLIMQWGTSAIGAVTTIALPIAFTTAFYSVVATEFVRGGGSRTTVQATPGALNNFTARAVNASGSTENTTIYWIAVGR